MKTLLRSVVSLLVILLPGLAGAGPNSAAMVQLHLTSVTNRQACGSRARPDCSNIVVTGALYPQCYFTYVLVTNGSSAVTGGVGGVSFGIQYDASSLSGVDVFSWHLCGDSESPTAGWPASGTGNLVSWNPETNCQRTEPGGAGTGVVAGAGYFYMAAYTPDRLSIVHHPGTGEVTMANCSGVADTLADRVACGIATLGSAGFGGLAGFDPCGSTRWCGGTCVISGPSECATGSTGNVYADTSNTYYEAWATSFNWTISGNGVIDSTHHRTAWVTAGMPGSFTLHLDIVGLENRASCTRVVGVVSEIPVQPATWGGIKALYR